MKRVFTAQEMRLVADNVCSDFTFARINVGSDTNPIYREIKPYEVAAMLLQAADMMEREEGREKKYEYGVLPCGINFVYQTRAEAEHKQSVLEQALSFQYPIVRRSVGEWEEVEDRK